MTYQPRPIAPFKIDILPVLDPSSFTAGNTIPCSGTPSNTRATVSSGEITLPSGSHWRLEFSGIFASTQNTGYTQFEIQFYDTATSQYIGQSMWGTTPGQNHYRKGRVVCTALILDSEISTSKTIGIKIISSVDLASGATYLYVGTPSARIMELPA